MKKLNKKIILGILVITASAGTLSGILIPILKNKTGSSSIEQKQVESHVVLARNIINAKSEVETQEKAQIFYGIIFYEQDITAIDDKQLKKVYTSAHTLANYIFKIKSTHNIKVKERKAKTTGLKEILFIFKDKSLTLKSTPLKENLSWQKREFDLKNDSFALFTTFLKDKIVKASFEPSKLKSIPDTLNNYIYRNKIYDTMELFFAFEAASPTGHDFPKYNMAYNDDEEAINAIKDYLLTLKTKDSSIVKKDLERNANLEINFKKGIAPSGTIVFKFKDYKATKNIAKFKNISLKEENLIAANAKIIGVTKITVTTPTIFMKRIVKYKTVPSHSDLNPPIQSGFSIWYKEATAINDKGQSKVTYTVDVDPKVAGTTTKELTFTVGGFETKIEHAQAKIDGVSAKTTLPPTKKTQVNYEIAPKLGNLNSPTQSGFSFTFTRATTVNDKGQSKVTYTVDVDPKVVGTTTKELTFTVGGFETKIEHAQAKIDGVSVLSITSPPTKKTQVNHGVAPKLENLNSPTQSGFSFTFTSATTVNDKGQSKITYTVDVDPKVVGTTTKEIIFTINGFETKVIANANTKIQNVAIETATVPTKKTQVNYGVVPKLENLNSPTQSGFSFTFTSATTVNDKGQSKVTYTVDVDPKVVGTTTKELTFTVGGFETKIEHAQAKIDGVSVLSITSPPTKKTQVNHGVAPKLNDLTPPTQSGFSFTFTRATAVNDKGQSKITYTVDVDPKVVGTTTKELTFTVGGFETKIEHAQAKIDGVSVLSITSPPTKKTQVNHGVAPKLNDLTPPTQSGFSFTFKRATAVNSRGESTVTYIVDVEPTIDGTTTKELEFIVSGLS